LINTQWLCKRVYVRFRYITGLMHFEIVVQFPDTDSPNIRPIDVVGGQ